MNKGVADMNHAKDLKRREKVNRVQALVLTKDREASIRMLEN